MEGDNRTEQPVAVGSSAPSAREHRTSDVKCLACGVYNIPENLVCGACGANLPLIYDKDGKVFRWETDSPYWDALHPKKGKPRLDAGSSAWVLRIAIVLASVCFALWMLLRHKS